METGVSLKPPDDIDRLVEVLGYDEERMAGMREKHGDNLLRILQRDWRRRQHTPRLLHRDSTRGYTGEPALALPGAGEEIDEESQRRITADAHAKEQDVETLAQAAREQHTLAQRLAEVRAEAARRKVDLSKDERVIKKRLQAIEKRLRAAA
jgi:hypothetical protein